MSCTHVPLPPCCCVRPAAAVVCRLPAACLLAGIAIGGDSFPGSTLSDHCLRYQNIPQIKMIVVLGELGGLDEYGLVNAMKEGEPRMWS